MVKKVTEKPLISDTDISSIFQLTNTDLIVQGKNKDCLILDEKLAKKQLFPLSSSSITSML